MDIRITIHPYEKDNLVAFGNVVFDNKYALENVRIKKSQEGNLYVDLPKYKTKKKDENGFDMLDENNNQIYEYRDVFHPITAQSRSELFDSIINEYWCAKNGQREVYKSGYYTLNSNTEISDATFNEYTDDKLIGFANVVFDNAFVLESAKLRISDKGEYLDLPKYKTASRDDHGNVKYDAQGNITPEYKDVFHPITKESYNNLLEAISNAHAQSKSSSISNSIEPVDDEIFLGSNKTR